MTKLIILLVLTLAISGCASPSPSTCQLNLGATKASIVAKCGRPTRTCAIIDQDGKLLETYIYKQVPTPQNISYVYFLEGRVIRYGVKSEKEETIPSPSKK
jgi:hypothetical protein